MLCLPLLLFTDGARVAFSQIHLYEYDFGKYPQNHKLTQLIKNVSSGILV